MRRLTRLALGFSKKWENLKAALALHFAYYNFCRVHRTLKVTPAMEAGITDHVWTIAVEPETPQQPGEPGPQPPEPEVSEFIDLSHQRALHRLAREEFSVIEVGGIKPTDTQVKATFKAWLEVKGYRNDEGVGSTKTVPVSDFDSVREGIRDHAKTMLEMAESLTQ